MRPSATQTTAAPWPGSFWIAHRRFALSHAGRSNPPPASTVMGVDSPTVTCRPAGTTAATLASSRLTANWPIPSRWVPKTPPLGVRSVTAPDTSSPRRTA